MGLVDGQVALVTGAARGIGRAVALRLAREGARVVANDLGCEVDGTGADERYADQVVAEILSSGGKAVASHDDVSTATGAAGAVQTAVDAFGAVDILVCCAGIVRDRTLLKMDEDSWDAVMTSMGRGTFLSIREAARQMVAQGNGGRIVAMTGLPGYLGNFGQANLAAACGAVHALVRTASIELQKHRIMVNAVAPLAKTRMTETLPLLQGFDNVTAEHVAPAVLYLASGLSGERTGFCLAVAGARVHSFRFIETAGKFKDDEAGMLTAEEIDEHWQAITRA